MKKLLVVAAFAFVSFAGQSQTTDEAFKKDVLKVIEGSGSTSQMTSALSQIMKMIPSDKQEAFKAEFNAMLPSLNDKMAVIYMETYSKEDIKAMLAFYESPIGKKIKEKSGILTEKSMAASQEWAKDLQPLMMKYIQE